MKKSGAVWVRLMPHRAFFAGTADKASGTDAQPAPQVLIFKGIADFSPTSK